MSFEKAVKEVIMEPLAPPPTNTTLTAVAGEENAAGEEKEMEKVEEVKEKIILGKEDLLLLVRFSSPFLSLSIDPSLF